MASSIKARVQARLKAAKFEYWTLVANQMAGRNAVAATVLMHLIDELDARRGTSIRISNEEWRRLYDFGRTRLRHAGEALAGCGITYLNHFVNTWKIDEAQFWAAFEEALALCNPDVSDSDTPAQNGQGEGVQNEQGTAEIEGDEPPDPVQNVPLILREREKGLVHVFSAFRLRFGGDLQRLLDRLLAAAVQLGESLTRAVVGRCMNAGGKTWHYVATALENEAQIATHGRQLALMPAVEVPRTAKPKKDLRIVNNESAPAVAWDWSPAVTDPEPKSDLQPVELSPERDGWETAAAQLRHHDRRFQEYLAGAEYVRTDGEALVVQVATGSARDLLQTRFYRNVVAAVGTAFGKTMPVRFEVAV